MSPRTLNGERAANAADRANKILKTLIKSDEDRIDNAERAWFKEQVYSDFNGKDQVESSFELRSSPPKLMSISPGHNTSVKADIRVYRPARPSDKIMTRGEEGGGRGGGGVPICIIGPDQSGPEIHVFS